MGLSRLRPRKRVIVHLKGADAPSVEGVLVSRSPEVVLEHADLLDKNPESGEEEKVQLQGRAVFFRDNVEFIQVAP